MYKQLVAGGPALSASQQDDMDVDYPNGNISGGVHEIIHPAEQVRRREI